jgi:chemotaxis protein histidine kinase CheA
VIEPDTEITDLFHAETTQRLDQMDTVLLAVESGHPDADAVGSLFRNAHTIKGGASMLGFDDIRALAHAAEDILARARDAGVFPPEFAATLLRATAALRALVAGSGEPIDGLLGDLAATRAALPVGDAGTPVAPEARAPEAVSPPETQAVSPPAAGATASASGCPDSTASSTVSI